LGERLKNIPGNLLQYLYQPYEKVSFKKLLMTKSKDRVSDLVNGHASRPNFTPIGATTPKLNFFTDI